MSKEIAMDVDPRTGNRHVPCIAVGGIGESKATEIGLGAGSDANFDLCGVHNAQGCKLGQMALHLPAHVRIATVARSGIEPVAAAAIAGPRSNALLQPQRQESV